MTGSRGLKELTNGCATIGDTRLFLGNGQAGEDLEVRLAGQEPPIRQRALNLLGAR